MKQISKKTSSRGRGQKSVIELEKENRELTKVIDGLEVENTSLKRAVRKLEAFIAQLPKEEKQPKKPSKKTLAKTCKKCFSKSLFPLEIPGGKIMICKDCNYREKV